MSFQQHRQIAARFLPDRYYYYYTLTKLATDPLYSAVRTAFAGTRQPLLDIGCGLGLLLHYLRLHDIDVDYYGVDNDAIKISKAQQVAARHGYANARFAACDPAIEFPDHRGSVAILDVLQFFQPAARDALLARVIECLTPGCKLVIRVGLEDQSWRAAVSRNGDRFAHRVRWMRSPPIAQPSRSELERLLAQHGLRSSFQPLWGYTPFNNWLIVAQK